MKPALRLLLAIVLACACGDDDSVPPPRDGSATDGPRADSSTPLDGGGSCNYCPADQPVSFFHECTPPLEAGCAAIPCTPGVTDCGQGWSCVDCSAAACCVCAACLPSCVRTEPAQGPLPEYLKLRTTYGTAGQEQDVVVEGFPFYVGALFYLARVGDSGDLMESGYSTCGRTFHAPARGPSTVPVWISQYGGGDPWVLAGFFTYTTGAVPSCIQPGYLCGTTDACCEIPEVPMGCVEGHCRTR